VLAPLGFARTLTVLKAATPARDGYGNDVWSGPEVAVPGCAWWPSSTTEANPVGGDVNTERFGCLFPDGTDVSSRDRVRLDDGSVWEVDGEPRQHWSPITGAVGGVYAWLARVTG
jgi:hypothetical protein